MGWLATDASSACGCGSFVWPNVSISGSGPSGQRLGLGIREQRVRAGGAADRLGRVVDQDVEGTLRRDGVGEGDDLGRVAQVDADDAEAVQPLGRVGQRGEAADRIAREPGRDRRVGAVAQQAQRDVHADLGATAGEQGALAGEIGAGVALRVAERRAVRAELVVERVDDACSAACRCSRRAT